MEEYWEYGASRVYKRGGQRAGHLAQADGEADGNLSLFGQRSENIRHPPTSLAPSSPRARAAGIVGIKHEPTAAESSEIDEVSMQNSRLGPLRLCIKSLAEIQRNSTSLVTEPLSPKLLIYCIL